MFFFPPSSFFSLNVLITQIRLQPAFHDGQFHAFTLGIIHNLIFGDLADGKVFGVRMREVDPADRGRREHREGFGERDAGVGGRIEEFKELFFLGVIGA